MKSLNKADLIWSFFGAFFGLFLALTYLTLAEDVFLATSRAVIFRIKIENPDDANDEARNRWIWARDGLNISSSLVTDDLLRNYISQKNLKDILSKEINEEEHLISELRSSIKIQYTGADENNFQIDVRHPNPSLALSLNRHVFNFLQYLAVGKDEEDFKALLQELSHQLAGHSESTSEHSFYRNKILKLKFEHTLARVQKSQGFRVIFYPHLKESPIWPKPLPIIIIAIIAGFFAVSFLRILKKSSELKI